MTAIRKFPGWLTSTEGITDFDRLPQAAKGYLNFVEIESGARIGMISTGPGREQTIVRDEFIAQLRSLIGTPAESKSRAQVRG